MDTNESIPVGRLLQRSVLATLTIMMASLISQPFAAAQLSTGKDFRIESSVYIADAGAPISQNVTLFTRGIVYDFRMPGGGQKTPSEIVMFDEGKRQLILMDVERRLSWTVADIRLLKMVDQLRRETANSPQAKFLVTEPLTENHDWSSNVASLSSESIKYTVRGERPADDSILPRYYDFLDQFTRLAASDPQRIPPFSRLSLNKTIKTLGWMPSEVKINIQANEFFKKPLIASSKHVMVMSLSDEDQQRIAHARRCWAEFKTCSLSEYRGLKRPSLARSSKRLAAKEETAAIPVKR